MTSAQVVEMSVTNHSFFQNYSHPDDHNIRITDTPGFKPFTMCLNNSTPTQLLFARQLFSYRLSGKG